MKLPGIVVIGGSAQIFIARTVRRMRRNRADFDGSPKEADTALVVAFNKGIQPSGMIFAVVNLVEF